MEIHSALIVAASYRDSYIEKINLVLVGDKSGFALLI
mgnify:CR=1 FL=1